MKAAALSPLLLTLATLGAMTGFALNQGLDPLLLAVSILGAAMPLLLAALGELVVERSGVLNLGVEGMMIFGAIAGFATAVSTQSPLAGFAVAAVAGAAIALLFGILTQLLYANQVATGLALTLFGLGLAALIGQPYSGVKPPPVPRLDIPEVSDLPYLGPLVFSHDAMIYVALAMVALVGVFLAKTRAGMILRAVGENHDAAHALGYRIVATRMVAIAFGGAMAGLGGAYLSLVRVPQWNEGMTAGAGWIALAIVVFGAWKPGRVMLGAFLFGGVTILQLNFQAAGITPLWLLPLGCLLFAISATLSRISGTGRMSIFGIASLWVATMVFAVVADALPIAIPAQYLSMTPYLVTILVLVVMSADKLRTSLNAPAMLGRPFTSQN